jgi:phosphatidylglycerophosphate synthase
MPGRISLIAQYKNSLKNPYAEELLDLVFYRPLAFVFVKITEPLPLTPNFVSLLAMIAGIAAGIAFAGGTAANFLLGAILFGCSNILDCSDGMIARLKKNGTKTGRIVDGLVDYIASGAVYIGLAAGMSGAVRHGGMALPFNPWLLVVLAALSTILHSISSDACRNAFIRQENAEGAPEDEFQVFSDELQRLGSGKGHLFDRVLISIYLRYLSIQKGRKPSPAAAKEPAKVTPLRAVLWNLIGPSTHISFIILAATLYRPMIFFVFVIVAANVWMVGLFIMQWLMPGKRLR